MKAVPFFLVLLLPWMAVAQEKAAPAKPPQDLRQRLQDGLFEEEANRNLEKASEAYEGLLSAYENDRKFAATALFRLGEIRVKQNRKDDAISLFQRVIAEFTSDPLAKLSRDRLTALGGELPKAGDGVPSSQEEREIARLQDLVKNSPDLLNARDGTSTPLARAAMEGWLKAATFLMDHGVDPKSKHGEEALRLAAATGRKAMVELLLSRGVDVNARDNNNGTALMRAVQSSHAEVTRLLLERGASPNIGMKENATPLHAACSQGNLELVRGLLEKGADLDAVSTSNPAPGSLDPNVGTFGTPLMTAIRGGHRPVINLLLQRKADVNIENTPNFTALWLAVELKQRDTAAILLEHGAKPADPRLIQNAIYQKDLELVRLLAKHGADVNAKHDEHGHAPLHNAVHVSAALVGLLIESGAKPNATNNEGETPLSVAMNSFDRNGGPSTSGPPSAGIPRPGPIPRTQTPRVAFSAATTTVNPNSENFEICKLLVAKGADVNARNQHGYSILHKALQHPAVPLEVVDWLIEKGAHVNARSKDGYTPATIAPVDRRIWLEERSLFPDLTKQRAVHTVFRFDALGKDIGPSRVEPVAEFDLPPPIDELIRRGAAEIHEAKGSNFAIYVYRMGDDGKVKRVSSVNVSNRYISEELPQLKWGDLVAVVDLREPGVRMSNTGAQFFSNWQPERKAAPAGKKVAVQIGAVERAITMRKDMGWMDTGTNEIPDWDFSHLVMRLTAAQPRADLGAVKVQRTVDGKAMEWTVDLRSDKLGHSVKELPARLGDGDRVIIPLKPENDPTALANRKTGIFRQAPGQLFGERVFHFTEKDDAPRTLGDVIVEAYSGSGIVIPNPDFSKIRIRRLKDDTGAEETLEVNLVARIEAVSAGTPEEEARKQDIALKPGDFVEWGSKADRPATEWKGLDGPARLFLNKALRRDVKVHTIGQSVDEFLLRPSFADYEWTGNEWQTKSHAGFGAFRGLAVITPGKNLLKVRLITGDRVREFGADEFSAVNPRLQDGDRLEVERF